jgi:hypothetical protein
MDSEQTSSARFLIGGEVSNAVGTKSQPDSQRGLRLYGRVDDVRRHRDVRAFAELGSISFGDLWCSLHNQRSTSPLDDVSGVRD